MLKNVLKKSNLWGIQTHKIYPEFRPAWHIKPVGPTALHGLFKMPGQRAIARGLV
jgi:hypothetical protein